MFGFSLMRIAVYSLLVMAPYCTSAQPQHPATHPNLAPQAARPASRQPNSANQGQGARNQEHLSEWMSRHRNLPMPEQQRALESEPGFRELPAQTQQRMRDRLTQLNNMRPADRQRIIERNEAMEHLSVPQRQQVRGAMLQLGSLPEDRRGVVARTFRQLRTMPDAERQQYLNSPAFRSQYNDQERLTLNGLMAVEPYIPGRRAGEAPPQ